MGAARYCGPLVSVLFFALAIIAVPNEAQSNGREEIFARICGDSAKRNLALADKQALLEELERDAPGAPETLAAKDWVARAAAEAGRMEEALALWHDLAGRAPWLPPEGAGDAGMWAMVAVNGAARNIAQYHEERGEWEKALAWWWEYDAIEPLGPGAMTSRELRTKRIRVCQMRLAAPWMGAGVLVAALGIGVLRWRRADE